MNQFFSYHMIDSYGCDYSTSGISPDNIETKIKAFFDRRTSDGPKFDTYVLYFSGDTYDTGDWALTGRILIVNIDQNITAIFNIDQNRTATFNIDQVLFSGN